MDSNIGVGEIDKDLLIETLIAIRDALVHPDDYHNINVSYETNSGYAYNKIDDFIYSIGGDPYPSEVI